MREIKTLAVLDHVDNWYGGLNRLFVMLCVILHVCIHPHDNKNGPLCNHGQGHGLT